MGFLAKHFNLRSHVQQNNNYVVFDEYYSAIAAAKGSPAGKEESRKSMSFDNSGVFGRSHMTSFQRPEHPQTTSLSQH